MNSHCSVCDREPDCGYEYKPCDYCNYRKFKPKITPLDYHIASIAEYKANKAEPFQRHELSKESK